MHIRRHLGVLPARMIAPDPAPLGARRSVSLRVVAPLLELRESLLLLRDSDHKNRVHGHFPRMHVSVPRGMVSAWSFPAHACERAAWDGECMVISRACM